MIECRYIDHETETDHAALSAEFGRLRGLGRIDLLLTCHRIEQYGSPIGDSPLKNTRLHTHTITGTGDVFERLANIAAGTKSQITGEWPIFSQVQDFVDRCASSERVHDLGEAALLAAHTAREETGFYSPDHATIALKALQQESRAGTLCIFGAGMLGMNLARTHGRLGYNDVLLITRDKKKARKNLRGSDGCRVMTLDEVRAEVPRGKCHVVVATTKLDDSRAASITSFVESLNCGRVVDVCGEALFSESNGHISLESSVMRAFIQKHNIDMERKKEHVEEKIRSVREEVVKALESKWTY